MPDSFLSDAQIESSINERGCIVCIGQISPTTRRKLEKHVKAGTLAKWRARWNAPFGGFGIGPLKTVYGLPELDPTRVAA